MRKFGSRLLKNIISATIQPTFEKSQALEPVPPFTSGDLSLKHMPLEELVEFRALNGRYPVRHIPFAVLSVHPCARGFLAVFESQSTRVFHA